MNQFEPKRAIILAAGRGKRLRPYTDKTPKPLLPVAGRPTLDYILSACQAAGVMDVCLIVGHLGEQIEAFVGNGRSWNMNASFITQTSLLGTAHAVQAAADFIQTPCFIMAGDYILPPDYLQTLKEAYLAAQTDLAVSLKQLPEAELNSRSSIRFADDGTILEIVEKPAPGTAPSTIGASLIYIVPTAITTFLNMLTMSQRQEYELPTTINHMLNAGYTMTGRLQDAPAEWEKPIS
ncbi:MAG: nucleotidyltransferase family protein [Chloroflexota bacterium]